MMETNAQTLRRLRAKAKAEGMCSICRARAAKLGRLTCEDCIKRACDAERKRRERGLCSCGRYPMPGTVTCTLCSEKSSRRKRDTRDRKERDGLCRQSGCWRHAEQDRSMCMFHLEQNREKAASIRHERRVLGLCAITGCDDGAADGRTMCRRHLKALRDRVK